MLNTTEGKEEVQEAVLIAGLSAVLGGLIHWGIDAIRECVKRRKEQETCLTSWRDVCKEVDRLAAVAKAEEAADGT